MPKTLTLQNRFKRGLITEAHGLDFPEDACTATDNCVFTLIGEVVRREGIDLDISKSFAIDTFTVNQAINAFKWIDAGGDGQTEIVVLQVGNTLYFYLSSVATDASPLSTKQLNTTVNIANFTAINNLNDPSKVECQFATGNGYLFVFHPDLDPFFCQYNTATNVVTATDITVQIRDFNGYFPEPGNPGINYRPLTLSSEHNYNLQNQGWTGNPKWTATSTTQYPLVLSASAPDNNLSLSTGTQTVTVQSGLSGVTNGMSITLQVTLNGLMKNVAANTFQAWGNTLVGAGTVTSYTGSTMVVDTVTSSQFGNNPGFQFFTGSTFVTQDSFVITPGNISNTVNTWFSDVGNYPSNSDIWFLYKDINNIFNPTTTFSNVVQPNSPAPQGHFIISAFDQGRQAVSGIPGLTDVSTPARPRTGAWFQGRVFYAGVDGTQYATGDAQTYTWTENIYFSQTIAAGDSTSFGNCYQQNDPTDETFSDILPTDGGVIIIPGTGAIYKLFTVQNGLLVFAQNGVWFITGNQGLGFTATSYSINKVSSVKTISGSSFVDVLGLPYFWNEEGIYKVATLANIPYGQGGLQVEPITIGTIQTFYNDIPKDSKLYVKGAYDPINYVVKWSYKSTQEIGIADRYLMDSVLNLNLANSAFYTYSVASTNATPYIAGVFYLDYPNSITNPAPTIEYVAISALSPGIGAMFANEHDTSYKDWSSVSAQDYSSSFTTGYSLQGKGVMKHQPTYVYVYSRNTVPFEYTIQGVWDYSINPNSGRDSPVYTVVNRLGQPNFGMIYRRHKVRGHGMVLQLNFGSVSGQPFDFMGWTVLNQVDQGV